MNFIEKKSNFVFDWLKIIIIYSEIAIIYYINKGQYFSNIHFFGEAAAYIYHLIRVVFYMMPVACAYVLAHLYMISKAKFYFQLDKYRAPAILWMFNIAAFFGQIYIIIIFNPYNTHFENVSVTLFGLIHLVEIISLVSVPILLMSLDQWVALFKENVNGPIKVLILLTFLYVGYIDRIISNFVGGHLIGPTISLAQYFYKFTGGEIRIKGFNDDGYPTITYDNFSGTITPGCAGYEGLSFIIVFLFLFFPYLKRVFNSLELALIFLFCMMSVFMMNAVRLALIIYIGENVSAKIATGGFHTNFGVLTLVLVSTICMGFVWTKTKFFANDNVKPEPLSHVLSGITLDTQLIFPLIVLLTASLITGLFSDGFNWLYPVMVTSGALALAPMRNKLSKFSVPSIFLPFIVGLIVFIIWVALIPRNPSYEVTFNENLNSHGIFIAILWITFRAVGSSIIVPIVEELAFRGAIWDLIIQSLDYKISLNIKKIVSLVLTSLGFGLLHDDIFAAILAGFIYGALRFLNYNYSYPIIAHIVTNSMIAVYVIVFRAWTYW